MDISKASNFERFVFDLLGRDGARVRQPVRHRVARPRRVHADAARSSRRIADFGFVSGTSTHADRLATIRDTWQRFGIVIDTHTADGLKVGREHRRDGPAAAGAGNRAAGQVRGHDPRGARPRARAAARASTASKTCPSASRCCLPTSTRSSTTSKAMSDPAVARAAVEPRRGAGAPVRGRGRRAHRRGRNRLHLRRAGPRAGRRCRLGHRRAARRQHLDGWLRAARRRRGSRGRGAAGQPTHPGWPRRCPAGRRARRRGSSPARSCRQAPMPW